MKILRNPKGDGVKDGRANRYPRGETESQGPRKKEPLPVSESEERLVLGP